MTGGEGFRVLIVSFSVTTALGLAWYRFIVSRFIDPNPWWEQSKET